MATAREHLAAAKSIMTLGLTAVAGREAYLAAFHAAEAFLFERTGKIAKTHRGLRTAFAGAARVESSVDPSFAGFLATAYELKSDADYSTRGRKVSAEQAPSAIDTAERMIDAIISALRSSGPPLSP